MIICIVGPTGVGKTKLSVKLAQKYKGIVLNADATQIYQELNIGSAKVMEEEKENVPHFLFDIKSPMDNYSVSDYQKDAREVLDNNKEKNIVIVGGTGLYLKALLYDYEFSKKENNLYEDLSNEELYQMALQKDHNMKIHQNNRIRLINFLNNNHITSGKNIKKYDAIFIGLTMDREKLYINADQRVDKMFANNLLDEVKSLYEKYPHSMILKRAIGYKELIPYLNGEITLEDAKNNIKKNTRHYIKRQYTWFNNQMDVKWFNVEDDFELTINKVVNYIESLNSK